MKAFLQIPIELNEKTIKSMIATTKGVTIICWADENIESNKETNKSIKLIDEKGKVIGLVNSVQLQYGKIVIPTKIFKEGDVK